MNFPRVVKCGFCKKASEPRVDGKVKCSLGKYAPDSNEPWWNPEVYHPCRKCKRDWERSPLNPPLFWKGVEVEAS